ncbi:MAG: hypothetical protein K8T10_01890 [Candidatus Eremiobacteraeota bacterium]|nr:hypothetical protein [Candidatus Eremiobacteraeota bacterium]
MDISRVRSFELPSGKYPAAEKEKKEVKSGDKETTPKDRLTHGDKESESPGLPEKVRRTGGNLFKSKLPKGVSLSDCGVPIAGINSAISGFPLPEEIFEQAMGNLSLSAGPGKVEKSEGVVKGREIALKQYDNIEMTDALRVPITSMRKNESAEGNSALPMSMVGVDLGDGLFYDLSGGITFNPFKMKSQDYRHIYINSSGSGANTNVTKSEDRVTFARPGANLTEVTQRGDEVVINQFSWPGNTFIRQNDDRTEVYQAGAGNRTIIEKRGDRTTIDHPFPFGRSYVTKQGNTTIVQSPDTVGNAYIRKSGSVTTIDFPFPGRQIQIIDSGNTKRILDPFDPANNITITRSGGYIVVRGADFADRTTININ